MANVPFSDLEECMKTDVLKDWMHRDDRIMSSPPSTCYSSPPTSSTTSSDNNARQQQHPHYEQQLPQSSLSSLESFLFLPQLPVVGDDGDEDAWLFTRQHYSRQQNQPTQRSPLQHQRSLSSSLLAIVNPTTKSSSGIRTYNNSNNPSSFTESKNDYHKISCNKQSDTTVSTSSGTHILTTTRCNADSQSEQSCSGSRHVCGGKPSNSLFPFIAANDTVIAAVSSSNSNNDDDAAATDVAALSILLCMLFLFNLVKNSIWVNDEYNNKIEPLSSPLTSASPSSRLQNRLIQSWNMPSIISPSSLFPTSAFSSTFKIPEILSVASSTSSHNDDHEEDNDDSNMRNLMLLDVPNFRFLMNNKTKCNIPRDDDNYFDGDGSDDDGTTTNNHGKGASNTTSTIFFMIIVHSAPQNFEERQVIRETWGSLQRLGQFQIRLVFLLGHELNHDADDKDYDHGNKSNNNISNDNFVADEKGDKMSSSGGSSSSKQKHHTFHSKIQRESQQHGDIVTGNFHDSYRNLTYKHLMSYLWVLNHCSHAKYVLKADDDAFIDIFQLFEFLIRTFGRNPEPALICNVFPEGTKPVRGSDVLGKKWAVTYEEYPYDSYPKYCGGLAYLATPNVNHEIYRVSRNMKNKYLWIDDVYVTGILRELAHVEPFYLNLRYSYDPEEYRKWLATNTVRRSSQIETANDEGHSSINDNTLDTDISDGRPAGVAATTATELSNQMTTERPPPYTSQKIPFMIVHMERGLQLGREMRELWNKTVAVWSASGLMN